MIERPVNETSTGISSELLKASSFMNRTEYGDALLCLSKAAVLIMSLDNGPIKEHYSARHYKIYKETRQKMGYPL